MTSTLGMALLGLLAREPLTGYELSRSLKGAVRHFWQVSHSQVYPELARLEEAGLVCHERIPQEGKPDQKRFSVTLEGREALKAWLVSPLQKAPKRNEMALRAYCMAQAEPKEARAFFSSQAQGHRATVQHFDTAMASLECGYSQELQDPVSEAFANLAVLRRGLAFERAQAEWCQWMAERMAPLKQG